MIIDASPSAGHMFFNSWIVAEVAIVGYGVAMFKFTDIFTAAQQQKNAVKLISFDSLRFGMESQYRT